METSNSREKIKRRKKRSGADTVPTSYARNLTIISLHQKKGSSLPLMKHVIAIRIICYNLIILRNFSPLGVRIYMCVVILNFLSMNLSMKKVVGIDQ